jgi:hypothetical protein
MNFFRKLNLSEKISNKLLHFADHYNNKIFELSETETNNQIYWHVSPVDNSFTYGYTIDDTDIKTPIDMIWENLNFCDWPGFELFEKFKTAKIAFCLNRHNFPLHRHGEFLNENQYLAYSLVISKIAGTLILGETGEGEFKIPKGYTTEINHHLHGKEYMIRQVVNIEENDIFVFDTTQWHTFHTSTPLSNNKYTLTMVLTETEEVNLNALCDSIELLDE